MGKSRRSARAGALSLRAVCIAAALTLGASAAATASHRQGWDKGHRGEALDLGGYALVFDDEFDSLDVTAAAGKGPWYAPVHASYGDARFDAPNGTTYRVQGGVLSIRAAKNGKGVWHSGTIQTVNSSGAGFAAKYGYFEARLKFPQMSGAWPAFWLKSQGDALPSAAPKAEIDIVEWYGGDPEGLHSAMHLRARQVPGGAKPSHWYQSSYARYPQLAAHWHLYGLLITPDWTIVYLDRKEVARHKTLDGFKTPLYPILSLTLYDKDAAKAVSPFELEADYVRVYAPHA